MGTTMKNRRSKDMEKALAEFLKDYINSGQMDVDMGELSASQRLQIVTKILPYCAVKQKETKEDSMGSRTGSDSLATFFQRFSGQR